MDLDLDLGYRCLSRSFTVKSPAKGFSTRHVLRASVFTSPSKLIISNSSGSYAVVAATEAVLRRGVFRDELDLSATWFQCQCFWNWVMTTRASFRPSSLLLFFSACFHLSISWEISLNRKDHPKSLALSLTETHQHHYHQQQ